ncbi:MAG: histidine kinase, partial [Microlunatus sp.]|nr:histidine kinase [Microlunatus sp.]
RLIADAALTAGRCRGVAVALPGARDAAESTAGPVSTVAPFVVDVVAGEARALRGAVLVPQPAARQLSGPDLVAYGLPDGFLLLVTCQVHDQPLGVIALHRDEPFGDDEIAMARAFASHVSLAIDHARNEHNRRRLAVYSDRERIARDLHDHVIQRIFAVGLGLQSTVRRLDDQALEDRVIGYIDDLDATIADMRSTVFSLQHGESGEDRSLRTELFGVVADTSEMLGSDPRVTFVGPLDSLVPRDLRSDVLAVVRESLTNVAKHAQASRVSLTVTADSRTHQLRVQVDDNGVGIGEGWGSGNGLRNAGVRAAYAGGRAEAVRRTEGGTRFLWEVPLPG